jgi:hypothetical protein
LRKAAHRTLQPTAGAGAIAEFDHYSTSGQSPFEFDQLA